MKSNGCTGSGLFVVLMGVLVSGLQAEPMHPGFTYQGVLEDAGAPADGPYDMTFTAYDNAFAGNQLNGTLVLDNVDVAGGVFSVELDFSAAIFTGEQAWLEIEVRPGASVDPADFALLGPRQKISPTPYALYSLAAGTVRHGTESRTTDPMLPSEATSLGRVAFDYNFASPPVVTVTGIYDAANPILLLPQVTNIDNDGFELVVINPVDIAYPSKTYTFNWTAVGNGSLMKSWYRDLDGDLYSDGVSIDSYDQPPGYFAGSALIRTSGDCDDGDPAINPEATEIWYDGVDQDCDGLSDYDQDYDGYDSGAHGGSDCNDLDPTVFPGAPEIPLDGIDQDCDGIDSTGLGVANLSPGDLVITEIMQNPAVVSDSQGEWFEVYNATGVVVDLSGLEIVDDLAAGFTVTGSLSVAPGDYVVFGNNGDPVTNGGAPVDYAYVNFPLGNASDTIILSYNLVEFDRVDYDGGIAFPDPSGASMSLNPTMLDALQNNAGSAWCAATSPFGAGDLGTPGSANDTCAPPPLGVADLSPGDLVITEIMQNPAVVSDSQGEWFEVYNATGSVVDLSGLGIFDNFASGFTVSGSLIVAAGDYVVFGINGDPVINGGAPVDYAYGAIFPLSNAGDTIILSYNLVEIDRVDYDGGFAFPDPSGASISLDPTKLDALQNNSGSSWCTATSQYGAGDFGTPGSANGGCP
ncbi:hypothetical protein G0Q06_10550 [Puniceicoccales bacterium CK1056]|uniref:LTD domain-containing protein n=1 Tax=Oceanipulchritudo coccoides TaxID=2706888 RepID=A0A6B2M1K6_9BACT|nr:lamin tail domain-containing protein [Oceanipulchritudo coccoides]NDV62891.1 hypothetical protein [Oceanipulchritudo coccoides]